MQSITRFLNLSTPASRYKTSTPLAKKLSYFRKLFLLCKPRRPIWCKFTSKRKMKSQKKDNIHSGRNDHMHNSEVFTESNSHCVWNTKCDRFTEKRVEWQDS